MKTNNLSNNVTHDIVCARTIFHLIINKYTKMICTIAYVYRLTIPISMYRHHAVALSTDPVSDAWNSPWWLGWFRVAHLSAFNWIYLLTKSPEAHVGTVRSLAVLRPRKPFSASTEYANLKIRPISIWLVACSAPSHYPNQCWLIDNWIPGNKF